MRLSTRQAVSVLAAVAATGVAITILLIAWSGVYNVAASRGHWPMVEWFLTFGMQNSVKTHALGIQAPPLDDENMVKLGAAHFAVACATCHGAPGVRPAATTQQTLPPPPNLSADMRPWRDRELFWIVKNGLKYTAMPAWPAQDRDDEVWAMVAFLKRLKGMSAEEFNSLSSGRSDDDRKPSERDDKLAGVTATLDNCARCHGESMRGPSSILVPQLHGQSAAFMTQALTDFAADRRASGIMGQAAGELLAGQIERLAAYYAALPPLETARPANADAIARGRTIAERGDASAGIPACLGCHSPDALAIFPRLAGQSAAYMQNRLRFWQGRTTPTTDSEAIMLPVARALNAAQIEDVSAFFAAQPPSGDRR